MNMNNEIGAGSGAIAQPGVAAPMGEAKQDDDLQARLDALKNNWVEYIFWQPAY